MSLDLTLLPVEFEANNFGFSHSVLRLDQGWKWSELLETVRLTDVPDHFNTYLCRGGEGETHYGETQMTPYGEPLRAARAGDILRAVDKHGVEHGWSRRDAAVIAYLRVLDPKMKIALYWH